MCVCVSFPFILDIKFVGRTSRGHTGGRSHRISHPPSFCGVCVCVCVCVFSSHSLWTSMDVPAGVTQEEGNRIFHPPSFCGACLNFSREKDSVIPFPRRPWSGILCTNDLIVLHPLGILFSFFSFSVRKIPFAGIELTSQRVRGYMLPLSYRGDRACLKFSREKDSAFPFPRRPWSRILCTNDFNRFSPVGRFYFCFLVF